MTPQEMADLRRRLDRIAALEEALLGIVRRRMTDGDPCWCISGGWRARALDAGHLHEGWVHSPTCLAARAALSGDPR